MSKHKILLCIPILLLSLRLSYPALAQPGAAKPGTATVSGRVILKGEPASGVAVVLQPQPQYYPPNPSTVLRAKTDETGRFRITGVTSGRHLISALAPGFAAPSDNYFGQAEKSLNILDGENVEDVVIELKRGGVITGRVIDAQGRPLTDQRVELTVVGKDGAKRSFNAGYGDDRYVIDDRGVYRVYGLPEGRYLVSAGFAPAAGRTFIQSGRTFYPKTFHPGVTDDSQAKVIEVTEGSEKTGVDISLGEVKKTHDIAGRVVNGDTGQPMAGVELAYGSLNESGRMGGYGSRGDRSDANGEFQLTGIMPGRYGIFVRGDAESDLYSEPAICDASEGDVSGAEVTSVDIRHRGESGHVVSGTLTGGGESSQPNAGASVTLISAATGAFVASSYLRPGEASNGFAIYGVSDGEYEIVAVRGGVNEEELFVSPPRRITVRGADVGGIELRLALMASVAGKIVLEKSENVCESNRKASIDEVVVSMRRDEKNSRPPPPGLATESAPADKGEFLIRYLDAGRYFIEPRLPVESWYVKSIAASAPIAPAGSRGTAAAPDLSRSGATLKAGEKISGLTVAVADGAVSLRGKVVAAKEGAQLPSRVRLHLVPAETAEAGNVLRYAEAVVRGDGRSDGAFTLNNIAPGKYWLVTRAVPDDEPSDRPPAPVAWDASERAKLRREAEAMKVEVELKPCQRAAEQIVKFAR